MTSAVPGQAGQTVGRSPEAAMDSFWDGKEGGLADGGPAEG